MGSFTVVGGVQHGLSHPFLPSPSVISSSGKQNTTEAFNRMMGAETIPFGFYPFIEASSLMVRRWWRRRRSLLWLQEEEEK